jgi:hypothetical protein
VSSLRLRLRLRSELTLGLQLSQSSAWSSGRLRLAHSIYPHLPCYSDEPSVPGALSQLGADFVLRRRFISLILGRWSQRYRNCPQQLHLPSNLGAGPANGRPSAQDLLRSCSEPQVQLARRRRVQGSDYRGTEQLFAQLYLGRFKIKYRKNWDLSLSIPLAVRKTSSAKHPSRSRRKLGIDVLMYRSGCAVYALPSLPSRLHIALERTYSTTATSPTPRHPHPIEQSATCPIERSSHSSASRQRSTRACTVVFGCSPSIQT